MKQNQNIPQGYKNSPLGIIPQEWEVKILDTIADIDKKSLDNKTPKDYEFDYVSLSDVDSNDFKIETTRQIFRSAPSRARRIVSKGDVLLATVRPNLQGFSIIRESVKDLIASTGFAVITATKCNNEYLFHLIFSHSISKQFYQLLIGSNYPAINSSDVKKLKILFPPLPEQQKIAEILSCWDDAIEKQTHLIAKLETRKRGLMQRLLGNEKVNRKNEKYGKVHLGNIAKITMGQSPNSEDYNTEKKGFPLIQGNADIQERKQVIRFWTDKSKKECDAGDIILTVRAPVGAIGIATHSSSIGRGVCSIKPESIDYWYLYHLLVFNEDNWKSLEQGSTFTAANSKDIFNFSLFIIHSIAEQTAIANILSTADKEIQKEQEKLAALKSQKKGLMQVLLMGKKRVKIETQG